MSCKMRTPKGWYRKMNFAHGKYAYAMLTRGAVTRGAVTMLVKIIIFYMSKRVHPTFLDFFFFTNFSKSMKKNCNLLMLIIHMRILKALDNKLEANKSAENSIYKLRLDGHFFSKSS